MAQMTGAQALVEALEAEGVDTVFALPGVQIMAAFDAMHGSEKINLIGVRHEQATTYMADGYARVTGKPGVALVVPGPGALNAAAGLLTAYSTSSPVLLISGQIPSASLGKHEGQLHEISEQLDVFRPITKWNTRVTSVEEVPGAIREAFRQMTTGRPRPVEVEIPPDVLAGEGDVRIEKPVHDPVQEPSRADIESAARALTRSRRPAIAIGGGALRADAGDTLAEVAEALQAPIVSTQQAKSVMPNSHPLYVGVHYAGIGVSGELLGESDVILAVGTRLQIRDFKLSPDQTLIQIDVDPEELAKDHGASVKINADARAALRSLAHELAETGAADETREPRAERYRQKYREMLKRRAAPQVEWVQAVREATARDAVIVSGMTNTGYWSHMAYYVEQGGEYISPGYGGTLGYGFPTALGAKVAAGDREVVALCGDGGFMYAVQELATARRYGINLATVVFDNGAYGASRWDQRHRYGDREIGTEFFNPDWETLARAFGVRCFSADSPEGLEAALKQALSLKEPVLIAVRQPLMAPPFQLVDGE
ncbi:MAG: thiamine pyrophosphate-binding protein [Chloroflexota bacterium]